MVSYYNMDMGMKHGDPMTGKNIQIGMLTRYHWVFELNYILSFE